MEVFSFSTSQYPIPSSITPLPLSSAIFSAKPFTSPTSSSSVFVCLKPPSDSTDSSNSPSLPGNNNLRRPNKSLQPSAPSSSHQNPRIPSNPLKKKNPFNSAYVSEVTTVQNHSQSLANKLWLTSKLSPPPPPPPPPPPFTPDQEEEETGSVESGENGSSDDSPPSAIRFRQEGKIFVGNLPNWIKKNEVAEFFRQFGPIKNVILIKGYNDTERNAGFGFVIYGGSTAEKSAMKAVEFDGVEFHGRVLTVKLDDGKRLKEKSEERARWVGGDEGVEYRSKWHEERESSRKEFKKIVETEPENWQAVVRSFESIKKVGS